MTTCRLTSIWILYWMVLCLGCGSAPDTPPQPSEQSTGEEPDRPQPPQVQVLPKEEIARQDAGSTEEETSLESTPMPPGTAKPGEVNPAETPSAADSIRATVIDVAGAAPMARQQAVDQLESLGLEAQDRLRSLLADSEPAVRRGAALFLLDRFDTADKAMGEAFVEALSDDDSLVRSLAVSAIRRMGASWVPPATDALITRLDPQAEQTSNRAAVARLLGDFPAALPEGQEKARQAAISALETSALKDPERSVRAAALVSLAKIAPPQQVVSICSAVLSSDREASLRSLAASRLRRLGPQAASAATVLASAMDDPDEAVRSKSAEALVELGDSSLPLLQGKLKASRAEVRKLAVYSLVALGPSAKQALPALRQCLQDPDAQVRELARLAIERLENL